MSEALESALIGACVGLAVAVGNLVVRIFWQIAGLIWGKSRRTPGAKP